MAVMLDPHDTCKDTSARLAIEAAAGEETSPSNQEEKPQLNLNCVYDFRPTNFSFLVLSRFSFATKKKRIQKLISKKIQAKKAQLRKSLARVEDQEKRMIETRQKETKLENKTIEALYHKLYYEVIA